MINNIESQDYGYKRESRKNVLLMKSGEFKVEKFMWLNLLFILEVLGYFHKCIKIGNKISLLAGILFLHEILKHRFSHFIEKANW